jgi:hydroxypyruvate isomerase
VLGRSMPSLDAQENLPEIFACLKRIGYDGTISLEASVKGDLAQEAAAALHCLRTLHAAS